jgi:hypothetical protein
MAASSPKGRDLVKNPQEMGCHGNGPPAGTNPEFVRRFGAEEGQTGKNSQADFEIELRLGEAATCCACSIETLPKLATEVSPGS